jgi:ribonuclease BN (tRNA processing enzyme)
MVHEATLEYAMEEKANSRGHSSTHQAAQLARDAGAGDSLLPTSVPAMTPKEVSIY